jgi:hypothetical protein
MLDSVLLVVLVAQGFFVLFYEYDVWRMNRERYTERRQWRLSKQKAQLKKILPPNANDPFESIT